MRNNGSSKNDSQEKLKRVENGIHYVTVVRKHHKTLLQTVLEPSVFIFSSQMNIFIDFLYFPILLAKLTRFSDCIQIFCLCGGTYRAKNTLPNRPKLQE